MFIKFIYDLRTRKTVPKPTETNSIYADSEKNPLRKIIYFITALTSPKHSVHSSWKDPVCFYPAYLPTANTRAGAI